MKRRLLLALPLALAACGHRNDSDPSGTTADEARQLNAAAAATDINAGTANASPPAEQSQ